ncbi:hypothetical protein [Serratia rhizosphaerae]|uniref:Uncharacterized protein n=1 Tax=Serratia rhizosphaerae TaxID=2597702 RepID=A0ABX6GTD8_9GAMM|nr:hypothetical protein [Serratia rhizosphaerae]QHA89551.1 hypothetical protein FO014_22610 [Serratia rhizosphaerae]
MKELFGLTKEKIMQSAISGVVHGSIMLEDMKELELWINGHTELERSPGNTISAVARAPDQECLGCAEKERRIKRLLDEAQKCYENIKQLNQDLQFEREERARWARRAQALCDVLDEEKKLSQARCADAEYWRKMHEEVSGQLDSVIHRTGCLVESGQCNEAGAHEK